MKSDSLPSPFFGNSSFSSLDFLSCPHRHLPSIYAPSATIKIFALISPKTLAVGKSSSLSKTFIFPWTSPEI